MSSIITFPPASGVGVSEDQIKSIINTGIANGSIQEKNYPRVDTYTDLPSADTKPNETYLVKSTIRVGIFLKKKSAGTYYSNGTEWVYMGDTLEINDEITTAEALWSSQKISNELSGKVSATLDQWIPTAEEQDNITALVINKIAGEDLLATDCVVIIDNVVWKADKDTSAHMSLTKYFARLDALTGSPVKLLQDSLLVKDDWGLSPELPYFLGNSGAITSIPPTTGFLQKVGCAVNSDIFSIEQSIAIKI